MIEMIVYIALFSFVIGAGISTAFFLTTEAGSTEREVLADAEANFLLRKTDRVLGGASSISSPVAGSSGSTLTVSNSGTVSITQSATDILIDRGSGWVLLTSGNFDVSSLNFTHVAPAGGRPAELQMTFTLSDKAYEKTYVLR